MAGIGGAAASGLESGFRMGLQATQADEARKQREFENQRQTAADQQRTDQLTRQNALQDKQSANAEEDRALSGVTQEMQDHALFGAGLAAQHGGPANIPAEQGQAYATKANEIGTRRAALLRKRYAPIVEKEQQWAKDTSSRIQTGQMSMDDLSPAETVRLIQATSRRPVADFLAPQGGKSKVKQGIDDTTAGMETGNSSLTIDGANNLLAPELQTGIGHVAPDGSQITGKSLYALVPAPQMGPAPAQQANPIQGLTAALNAASAPAPPPGAAPQPGQDQQAQPPQAVPQQPAGSGTLMPSQTPGKVLPVLQVTARHPDGTEVTYHAPVTQGRNTDPNAPLSGPLDMGEAMDRMGKIGVLEAWANTPKARAKIEQGLKELGGDANSFLGSYYAMHGDAKALLPPGSTDPTSQKIAAIQKFAVANNIPFEEARKQIFGVASGGVLAKLDAIRSSDMSPEDKETATKVALGAAKLAAPKAGGTDMTPEAIDQTAAAALKDRTALVGIGRDPNKVTAVLNRMAELSPGGDIAGNRALFKADTKSLDKMIPQYDAVVSFENNTLAQGKVLVGLAKKVDTTGVPVIERWVRAGRKSLAGDPDVTEFNAQLQLFGNEAAKILTNPNLTGVLSDSARHEVAGFLPESASAAQIERVVSRLESDFELRRKSIEDQTATITKRMAAREPAKAAGIGGGGASTNPGQVSPADQVARDKDALKILQQERAGVQQRVAAGDPRAAGDLAALDREIAKTQKTAGGTGLSAPRAAAGGPKQIATDADYNALPPGATFVGPDGKTRRKP